MDDKNTPLTTCNDNGNSTPTNGESLADLKRRIVELEAVVDKMTRQREETRKMIFQLQTVAFPNDPPPTEEELLEEQKTLTELSISQLIVELESDVGARGQ
jgi:hypothetical protein